MTILNATHDPTRRSWLESANAADCEFPIQNLALGIFTSEGRTPRGGVAIGDCIVDLSVLDGLGLFDGGAQQAAAAAASPSLNALLALGNGPASALRARLSDLLLEGAVEQAAIRPTLIPMTHARLQLPVCINNFTDFFASIYHTERGGRVTRPDNPIPLCYRSLPIGYNSRASTIRIASEPVRRPNVQWRRPDGSIVFGPTESLDYELEMGVFIGPGNALGVPISMTAAPDQLFGYCLVNDWSARDLQRWESTLGPFLSKAFATSISPWIVTAEALAPFAQPSTRPTADPPPLPYLDSAADRAGGLLDIALTVQIASAAMRAAGLPPHTIAVSNTRYLYWSFAQMVVHHASGGCNLQPGDLLGSGTISGPTDDSRACLSESTRRGTEPFLLPSGESRTWLLDDDDLIFSARAQRDGFVPIGFGDCRMRIAPAPAWPR